MKIKRCAWVTETPLYLDYHDLEWGVPVYDERLLFELLILEGMQAGLSWLTVLKKRANYRASFDNFEAAVIANYDRAKIEQLSNNPGIIRNALKIQSVVTNAQAYLKVQQEYASFARYIWSFVDGKPVQNQWTTQEQVPTQTCASEAMARDLKKRGFKFVGSTICYAFMQATGMVNDHLISCHCYKKCIANQALPLNPQF